MGLNSRVNKIEKTLGAEVDCPNGIPAWAWEVANSVDLKIDYRPLERALREEKIRRGEDPGPEPIERPRPTRLQRAEELSEKCQSYEKYEKSIDLTQVKKALDAIEERTNRRQSPP